MDRDLRGRVVVISPHLDDGVLSLGAAIARATRAGAEVRVVTVLANDPESPSPASEWDAACGFRSADEAARARRDEDLQACQLVGATPVWLPFGDEEHGREASDEEIYSAIAEVFDADTLLLPGFPLAHPDHAWLTRLMLERRDVSARIGFYVEQPYATWRYVGRGRRSWAVPGLTPRTGVANLVRMLLRTPQGRHMQRPALPDELAALVGGQPQWRALRAGPRARIAKQRALRAYASQLRGFGSSATSLIAFYELGFGGEGLAWLE